MMAKPKSKAKGKAKANASGSRKRAQPEEIPDEDEETGLTGEEKKKTPEKSQWSADQCDILSVSYTHLTLPTKRIV